VGNPAATAFVSAREAAEWCGVSEKTVRRWIAAGRLKADKSGREFRIPRGDLDPFCRQPRPPDTGAAEPPASAVTDRSAPESTGPGRPGAAGHPPETPTTYLAEFVAQLRREIAELRAEVVLKAETAAMWQARAELLAAELMEARDRLAQQASGDDDPNRPWLSRGNGDHAGTNPLVYVVMAVLTVIAVGVGTSFLLDLAGVR
jgi:excisionase family DNA binding protein